MTDVTSETRACDYCTTEIAAAARRCPHCAGEFRFCRKCGRHVGTNNFQKSGWLRGGRAIQYRCLHCDTVIEGPRV